MLIDLPPIREYSMADCQDLFVSRMDEDCDIGGLDGCGGSIFKNRDPGLLSVSPDRGVHGVLSDAEPFTCTSSSDSDADMCFSDIEAPRGMPLPLPLGENSDSETHSDSDSSMATVLTGSEKKARRDLILHSPGQLLGTPRDSSRRYEYPFPAHMCQADSDVLDDSASSTATTPGLTPAEGSSLGLVSLAALTGISGRSTSLPMFLQGSAPAPSPVPVPLPVPAANSGSKISNTLLAPLSQAAPLSGPSSAPALSTSPNGISTIAAHPKLSRFNPADTPVPPGLRARGRTRNSASVSAPQVPQPVITSVVIPPAGAVSAVPAATVTRL